VNIVSEDALKEAIQKIILKTEDQFEDSGKPRLLKVKGKNASSDSVIRLSMAIMHSLSKYSFADLQAIAPPAIARLERAYIKAKGILSEYTNDFILVKVSSFIKIKIDETGMETDDDDKAVETYDGVRARVFAIPSYLVPIN
jgi:stage V sporulation protein SpoVS